MRSTHAHPGLLLAACWLLFAGCEPASVTDARDQLARGGQRITSLTIPILQDTQSIGNFLSGDTTTLNGLVALKFDPDSVTVDVGNKLQFTGINLTQLTFTAPGAALAQSGTFTISPPANPVLSGETRLTAIDTIVAESGSLVFTTQNRLPAIITYTLTLNGFKNAAGATLSQTSTVAASANNGSYQTGTMTFPLAGVTITPALVSAGLSLTMTGPVDPTWASNAVIQSGTGSMVVRTLSGSLNSAQTPELSFAVENAEELPSSAVDFGDFKDAVASSTLNAATANLTVINTAQTPVVLSNFRLGAVRCVGTTNPCQLQRDGSGNLVYEKNGAGTSILVTIADPGQTTLTLARGATKNLALNSAALVDRLAHLLTGAPPVRIALVTTGTATVGDGAKSRIQRTDFVKVRFQLVVGMDLTIPAAGVVFVQRQRGSGMDLSVQDGDDLASRIVQASATARVTNSTPFGVVAQLVLAPDSVPVTVDIFTLSTRVTLDSVVLRAPAVDASGLVTAPVTDSVSLALTGAQSRLFFNKRFSAGLRIRLLPGAGGGGRGAIRTTDKIVVSAKAQLQVRSGGGS